VSAGFNVYTDNLWIKLVLAIDYPPICIIKVNLIQNLIFPVYIDCILFNELILYKTNVKKIKNKINLNVGLGFKRMWV